MPQVRKKDLLVFQIYYFTKTTKIVFVVAGPLADFDDRKIIDLRSSMLEC